MDPGDVSAPQAWVSETDRDGYSIVFEDLHGKSHPHRVGGFQCLPFARQLIVGVVPETCPGGDCDNDAKFGHRLGGIRRLCMFVDASMSSPKAVDLGDVDIAWVDRFERYLVSEIDAGLRPGTASNYGSQGRAVLTLALDHVNLLDPVMEARLAFAAEPRLAGRERTPADSYSDVVAKAMYTAALEDVLKLHERRRDDGPFPLDVHNAISCAVALGFTTGIASEAITGLTRSPITPSIADGHVTLNYWKGHARGNEAQTSVVRDGAVWTPGGVVRLVAELTHVNAQDLEHESGVAPHGLWVVRNSGKRPYLADAGPRLIHTQRTVAWVERNRLGSLLAEHGDRLMLGRIRKTFARIMYEHRGDVGDMPQDHVMEVLLDDYADLPSLREAHLQTAVNGITRAWSDALRIVPDDAEEIADVAGVTPATARDLRDGRQDLQVGACLDVTQSPYSTPGKACRSAGTLCFSCENCVLVANHRHLVQILHYQAYLEERRDSMPAPEFSDEYGQAWWVIHDRYLPRFTSTEIEAAYEEVRNAETLYVPPEQRQ